ncbi:T9SS type B sorting domain-containing protein [Flavobacterium sp. RHBU_24]|uniref:T9SS type B sorting domain-containing protein n=1 Tax=Flavobacterium sp. RHBU_24 TaxID=3391185 RepID=UPI0039849B7B
MIISVLKSFYEATAPLKKSAALLFLLSFSIVCSAQDFTLQVSVTHENCAGNGMLSFSVTGAAPAPPVNYKAVRLPATTVADGTATTVNNLQAGTYTVTATQTVNGITSTDQVQVVIENQIVPLTYTVSGQKPICGNDGMLMVNVVTGNAVTYEIISGPVMAGPQASNIFTGVPAGFYMIRAANACGSAPVVSFTLFSDAVDLNISNSYFPGETLPACDLINIANVISPATNVPLQYPITAYYTIYPPDGSPPVQVPAVMESGDGTQALFSATIPFYYQTPYDCQITVTDRCGNTYTKTTEANVAMQAAILFDKDGCGKKMMISLSKFVAPFTITFTQLPSPPVLDPVALNAAYPGPFYSAVNQFGGEEDEFPLGIYEVSITDACGRTAIGQTELIPPPPPIAIEVGSNNDCLNNLGEIEIITPPNTIVEITIVDGPDEYIPDLPQDVFAYVNGDEGLAMTGMPPGTYFFDIVDECGLIYDNVQVDVPEYSDSGIVGLQRPDCTPGLGSAMLGSQLTEAILLDAPVAYTQNFPQDLTANIAEDGNLYLEALPPGPYKFKLTSPCTGTAEKLVNVTGNEVTQNDFIYTPYCGSFDLEIQHVGTANASVQFWLQKEYGPGTGIWGHPDGTTPYDGTVINNQNSRAVQNNAVNYSLIYPTGRYRVLKTFKAFSPSEESGLKTCYLEIFDFEYSNGLQVVGVESLTCGGGPTDVEINVIGVSPMTFTIVKKDGLTVNIPNGSSNIFTGLDPALYTIEVSDPCSNIETFSFNIADLPPPVTAYPAPGFEECDPEGDGMQTFNLSTQNSAILGTQDASLLNLTYHASLADATQGINPLPVTLTTGTTTVYARVEVAANPTLCYAISSFGITVYSKFELNIDDVVQGCEGEPNEINAGAGYSSYLWSTGETTPAIYPDHYGTFDVTVTDANNCTATKTIMLSTTAAPVITEIDINDWTDNNNIITVQLAHFEGSMEDVEFSIDGITWQGSNVFTGLPPGKYYIYARDRRGCGDADPFSTFLLTYPKFFTPNGDSYNETWRIKFSSAAEPDMMVYIYDRFGKLITGFDAGSPGWDGTLNGTLLPSTDYWFVVKRQNGKEYRGHFSLIR